MHCVDIISDGGNDALWSGDSRRLTDIPRQIELSTLSASGTKYWASHLDILRDDGLFSLCILCFKVAVQKLPNSLAQFATLFWPEVGERLKHDSYDSRDISIVTAFFDLGREDWKVESGKKSPFQRSTDHYFEYFSHLARLKNPMVIFVAPEHRLRVLELRRKAGLERITHIFSVSDLFQVPALKVLAAEVQSKMTPSLRAWTRFPKSPEYNYSNYVILDALKSIFINTAIDAEVVRTEQVAWVDFGYARDEKCFDTTKPWRFDGGGKINLFHMRPIDDLPIFRVVQRGYVYFQGGCKIGPISAWPAFSEAIDHSLASLLKADLVDDEQTLLLMAWRANPDFYRIHAVDRRDWRVVIRFFNESMMGEDVKFRDYRIVNALKESGPGKFARSLASVTGRMIDKFI